MFIYDKKLQYPIKIANTDPRLASIIISQYGGPDGELGASLRYLSQRYSMPYPELKGLLTDIGTEALSAQHKPGQRLLAGFSFNFVPVSFGMYLRQSHKRLPYHRPEALRSNLRLRKRHRCRRMNSELAVQAPFLLRYGLTPAPCRSSRR